MVLETIVTVTGIISTIITVIMFLLGLVKAVIEFLLQGVVGIFRLGFIPLQTIFGWIIFRTDRLIEDLETTIYPHEAPIIPEIEKTSVNNPIGNISKIIEAILAEIRAIIGEILLMYSPVFWVIIPILTVFGIFLIFPISTFLYYRVAFAIIGFLEIAWNVLLQAYATIWNTIIVPSLVTFAPIWNELLRAIWEVVKYIFQELIDYVCGGGDPLGATLAARCPNLQVIFDYILNSLPDLINTIQTVFNFIVTAFNSIEDIVCPGASCSPEFCIRATNGASTICTFTIQGLLAAMLSLFSDLVDIVIPAFVLTFTFARELSGIAIGVFGGFLLDLISALATLAGSPIAIPSIISNFVASVSTIPPFDTESMSVPSELIDLQTIYTFVLTGIYYTADYVLQLIYTVLEGIDTLICNVLGFLTQCATAKVCFLVFNIVLNLTINTFFGPLAIPVDLTPVCSGIGLNRQLCPCDVCPRVIPAPININLYADYLTPAVIPNLGNRPFDLITEEGPSGAVATRWAQLGATQLLPSEFGGAALNPKFNSLYFNELQVNAELAPTGIVIWMSCRNKFQGCLVHACLESNSIFRTWINPRSEQLRYEPP